MMRTIAGGTPSRPTPATPATPRPAASSAACRRTRAIAFASTLVALLAACTPATQVAAPAAVDFGPDDVCESNGLRPFDHPGPKGQLHLADRARPVFFCDTVELLHSVLTEPRPQRILAAYVQDAGRSEWMAPRGQWIDARSAWYVGGSKRIGPLGSTLAPFSDAASAEAFRNAFGGETLRFTEITPDHVALDGGALHDTRM